MQDFRNLDVWLKAHELTLAIYRMTKNFPDHERYGLTSQLRRATASIPANIAEGCGRGTDADFARFVQIAMGSSSEVEYHVLLARDLGYMTSVEYTPLDEAITRIKRMLTSLLKKIRAT